MTEAQFDPKRGISQIASKAEFLAMDFPSYEATMAELLELSMPSALAGDRTSGGDHSDPTLAGLFQRERVEGEWSEYNACLQKALAHLNRAYNLSSSRARFSGASEHLAAKNAAWCQCSSSVEPWGDPMCTQLGVKDGLASACYTRRRRYQQDPEGYVPREKRRRIDPKDHAA